MRGFSLIPILSLGALVACGGPAKPANDATSTDEPPPKWDSSSETASNPTHSSSDDTSSSSGGDDTGGAGSSSASSGRPSAGSSGGASSGGGATRPPPVAAGQHLPAGFGGQSYPRDQTEVVLNRAARQVKANCGAAKDDNGNATGPWGKTSITVTLGHNGHAKGATIGSPFDDKPTGRCAVQAFKYLTFAPFAGPDTDVAWDIEIVKP